MHTREISLVPPGYLFCLAPARTGSRVPRAAASPDNCANCRVEHRSRFGTDNGAGSRGNSRPPNSGSGLLGGLAVPSIPSMRTIRNTIISLLPFLWCIWMSPRRSRITCCELQ